MSVMEGKESAERVAEGLSRAASCCRELAKINDAQEWKDLSAQLLIMRKKALSIYQKKPLSEAQIQGLVAEMELAQIMSQQMMAN